MSDRRLGVFICHCGGNISDYVDVEKVRAEVEKDPDVVVARTTMFACSDASQEEIKAHIKEHDLDGIVVASCSPRLHLETFKGVAERAGMNPYCYSQANIREQCSWAHRNEMPQATDKAVRIIRSALAHTRLSEELSTIRVETTPRVVVIGAGMAGMVASLTLADMGLDVFLVEREAEVGGWTKRWGKLFPSERQGAELVKELHEKVKAQPKITLFTEAELVEKSGTVGDFTVTLRVKDKSNISLKVGAIIVATGFDPYQPAENEYGWGGDRVVTLRREVKTVAYIYCVGSRQSEDCGLEHPNQYCSRYCCSAAVHAGIKAVARDPELNQYHLYRDMRTYGKYELLYEKASHEGSVFVRFDEEAPPEVFPEGDKMIVKAADVLDAGEDIEIPADLVVLVTGMVPRKNDALIAALKIPTDGGGFFNEIHPKLRPVETAINGVFIAGASQGPKTLSESVASSLAAVAKGGALVMKGYVDLDPHVAVVDPDACTWCGKCAEACPYGAIEKVKEGDKEVARVIDALCKGGGPCVPACPEGALDLKGYTNGQIRSMIESMLKEAV
ncbi:MAG: CoB--CoM heterodisulfide reductase iron-sulfur subunit A family protein [Acidobacteriota bacterium]